ncbi:MAG: dephospho-CoA kinase [Clostridia bacterium]|nr:dephospho-CoA kinase [Clostridia bacterium]
MKVIGLCGGSGSGKGALCELFRQKNIPTIDTDLVYREITVGRSECLSALEKAFGKDIITEDGALNRRILSNIVFSGENSERRLALLNSIAHRYILDEVRLRLNEYRLRGCSAAVVDAPVLYESGFDRECDIIICVIADYETRISRIMARDNLSRDAAVMRISSQISDAELISKVDYVIENNSDIEALDNQLRAVLKQIFD